MEDVPCGCPTTNVSTVVPEIKRDVVLENSGYADTFIAKYSPTGSVLWAARIGGAGDDDYGYGIATDANNNIVVTGIYYSNPVTIYNAAGDAVQTLDNSGSAGSNDTFLAKYSPDGNVVWAARIGGADGDVGNGIATDANSNIVVTGSYYSNPVTIYNASGDAVQTLDNSGSAGSNDTAKVSARG